MRSTLTIDPDVEQLLRLAIARTRKPFKVVVNEALRRGLGEVGAERPRAYRLTPHDLGWDPTLDPAGFNRLADQLALEAIAGTLDSRRE